MSDARITTRIHAALAELHKADPEAPAVVARLLAGIMSDFQSYYPHGPPYSAVAWGQQIVAAWRREHEAPKPADVLVGPATGTAKL